MRPTRLFTAAMLALLTSGCASADYLLFTTNTAMDIEYDIKPPTLHAGYRRREVVVAPEYEDGNVHPVLTSVHSGGGLAGGLGLTSSHSFAVGDAALVLADAFTSDERYEFAGENQRVPHPLDQTRTKGTASHAKLDADGGIVTGIERGDRRVYFFGTDTTLGVSVQGETSLPTAASIGFRRKEAAIVPLIETPAGKDLTRIKVPSLIATAAGDVKVQLAAGQEPTTVGIAQFFATGPAATLLASHSGVRRVLGEQIVPGASASQAVSGLLASGDLMAAVLIKDIYKELAGDMQSDPTAKKAVTLLNDVGGQFSAQLGAPYVDTRGGVGVPFQLVVTDPAPDLTAKGFDRVYDALTKLYETQRAIDKFVGDAANNRTLTGTGRDALLSAAGVTGVAAGAHPTAPADWDAIEKTLSGEAYRGMTEARIQAIYKLLADSDAVRRAVDTYVQLKTKEK